MTESDDVKYTRPDYDQAAERWKLIDDCLNMDNLPDYLRKLDPHLPDSDKGKQQRNKDYQSAAQFYPLLSDALTNVTASAFKKEPERDIPSSLNYMLENIDGRGVGLNQQARKSFFTGLSKSRGALYVGVGEEGGDARIYTAMPEQIINWRYDVVNGVNTLVLVVLQHKVLIEDGDFSQEYQDQYMVFRNNGVVSSQLYTADKDGLIIEGEVMPIVDGNGAQLDEIPVYFYGSLNNDAEIDRILMYPQARLNMGHYQNSADFEAAAYYVGHPVFSVKEFVGESQIKEMGEVGAPIGPASILGVPVEMNQASETTMHRTAMQDKEKAISEALAAMVGVASAKTATQVETENEQSTNILMMIAKNVSDAYRKALRMALRLNKQSDFEVVYQINTDFIRPAPDSQLLRELREGVIQRAYLPEMLYGYLRRVGMISDEIALDDFVEGTQSGPVD
jgi:hypothetical protein